MRRSIGPAMPVIAFIAIALAGFTTLAKAETASASWPHYTVINLGTLGGSLGDGYGGVTNNGWVSGDSSLMGDLTEHAALWRRNVVGQFVVTDLGTLGGMNSSTGWPQKNNRGLIVGNAQISQIDPLQEYWGAGFGCPSANPCTGWQNLVVGFVWQNGVMTGVPTLGGNNSAAVGANNLGQVVGYAETAHQDSSCVPPQVLDIKAVVWGPRKGQIHELPTYGSDVLAAAVGINDNGDVVGLSGTCAVPVYNTALAVHAVVWRNGQVSNLPGLGGVMNNAAFAINNSGQIVGISDPRGDATTYAVLWQNGAITNLGVLPGDVTSVAYDINAQGQVVGDSCDAAFNCRAFLWDHGVMMDLNSLIPPTSPLYLTGVGGINDEGEIAGTAALKSNPNEAPAFLAIPAPAAQIAGNSAQKMMLPENIRASLKRRLRLGHPVDRATAQQ
jgi:probable HAF family extracellular repeat protein